MASVRCPECDHKERIPDDHERSTIRCSECGIKIPIPADEDDDPRPRRSRADKEDKEVVRPKKKKKKSPPSALASWVAVLARLDTSLKIIVGLAIVALMLSCIHPTLYVVPAVYGGILVLLGSVLFLIVVFNDSPFELLMCMFLPFYSLYYVVTHWDETKSALMLQVFGIVVCVSFLCAMPLHMLVYGTRGPLAGVDGPNNAKPGDASKARVNRLLTDLAGEDPLNRKKAAEDLAKIKPNDRQPEVAKKLLEAAGHKDFFTRGSAFTALLVWASPDQIPEFIAMLKHKEADVRQGAIKALGNFRDDPRVIQPVAQSLAEFFTRDQAKLLLIKIGPKAEKDVLSMLDTKDELQRRAVLEVLQEIGTQESLPALEALKGNIVNRKETQAAINAIKARAK